MTEENISDYRILLNNGVLSKSCRPVSALLGKQSQRQKYRFWETTLFSFRQTLVGVLIRSKSFGVNLGEYCLITSLQHDENFFFPSFSNFEVLRNFHFSFITQLCNPKFLFWIVNSQTPRVFWTFFFLIKIINGTGKSWVR